MPMACEIPPVTLKGSDVALFLCGIEVPIEKVDFKQQSKKTEVTSTASYWNGTLWEEHAPGSRGGSLSWDSKWRVGQLVTPPSLRVGAIYPVSLYVRRPGGADPGAAYTMNLFIDDASLSFDPKAGVIEWKISGSVTGPIIEPG